MESTFELLASPREHVVAPMRLAYHKVRGAYTPWSRVQTLDAAAEALERLGIERIGPAWGLYADLPHPEGEPEAWSAYFGYEIPDGARVPPSPALRVVHLPRFEAVGLRYRGDLTSFPSALRYLVEWSLKRGLDAEGPLVQRFFVSDALEGIEERDVLLPTAPLRIE